MEYTHLILYYRCLLLNNTLAISEAIALVASGRLNCFAR